MGDAGLQEVRNPSALFLGEGGERAAGAAVFAGIEGSRPVLVEFQALVAPSAYGTPRRAVVGWDSGRLAMVMAVLEARCGLGFATRDVYLNVAGGLKVGEPAADLAAAAALVSSASGAALPQDCVVFGEISLSGDVRPRVEKRDAPEGSGQAGLLSGARAGAEARRYGGRAPVGRDAAGGCGERDRGTGVGRSTAMSLFDLGAGLVLLVSVLVGWFRGGTREVATVAAIVIAAIVSLVALRLTGPIARHAISTPWLANVVAILIVFGAVYILLRVAASALTRRLHQSSALGNLDRLAGAGFGTRCARSSCWDSLT